MILEVSPQGRPESKGWGRPFKSIDVVKERYAANLILTESVVVICRRHGSDSQTEIVIYQYRNLKLKSPTITNIFFSADLHRFQER